MFAISFFFSCVWIGGWGILLVWIGELELENPPHTHTQNSMVTMREGGFKP